MSYSYKQFRLALLVMLGLALYGGCSNQEVQTTNRFSLIETNSISAGEQCEAGGVAVDFGIDSNENNLLDSSEIISTRYVCHGTNGSDGNDGADGTDGTNGTNGTNGSDGADGLKSLISITPATIGSQDTLTFGSSASPSSGVYLIAANLELLAVDAPGDTLSNGNNWTHYYYDINGFVNAYEWRPSVNTENYYTLRTSDGSKVGWKSINLIDDGNWTTASITFYAYKDGVQTASEVRNGDIPWSGGSEATTYTFVAPEFAWADTIVIAPRAADDSATPIGITQVIWQDGCPNGGQMIQVGLDLDNDGILDAEEVQTDALICNGE